MRRQLLLQRVLAGWLAALLLVAGLWIPAQRAPSVRAAPSNDLKYDYAEVLGKSLLFYEAQRAGPRDPRYTWRVDWRQPAALNDGQDVGGDLAGGWFDAGDHVKFGLPMAASATLLAWGYYEAPGAYAASGQKPYLLDNLRFVLDYFLNAYQEGAPETATDDIFHYQVGDPGPDHAFWGPPEKMTMPRPTYSCTASAPCSEVTAGTAAALAAGALVFATGEPAYAATLRGKAERLYRFADTYRSGSGYRAANGFYTSFSGYWDELAWGATWLYLLTGDSHYLDTARETIAKAQDAASWAHNWDNASIGTYLLLARITGDPAYRQVMERHLDYWADTLTRTPGGLRFLNQWGSLRYASTTAFLALVYAGQTSDAGRVAKYRSFALSQINYILGDNPRNSSYVVGFGNNPPKNPHHRAAHDSPTFSINAPAVNRHELTGALVGGPASADDFDWRDDRSDYIRNEVATDYNAGFTGALAEILELASDGYTPPAPTATPPAAPTATLPPSPASPTPGATPVTAELAARLASQSNWGTGYCADVAVQNTTGNAVAWSTRVPVEGRLTQIWSASGAVAGAYLTVRGLDWNGVLQPGAGTTFGFCADRDPAATPTQPPATPTAAPVSPTSMHRARRRNRQIHRSAPHRRSPRPRRPRQNRPLCPRRHHPVRTCRLPSSCNPIGAAATAPTYASRTRPPKRLPGRCAYRSRARSARSGTPSGRQPAATSPPRASRGTRSSRRAARRPSGSAPFARHRSPRRLAPRRRVQRPPRRPGASGRCSCRRSGGAHSAAGKESGARSAAPLGLTAPFRVSFLTGESGRCPWREAVHADLIHKPSSDQRPLIGPSRASRLSWTSAVTLAWRNCSPSRPFFFRSCLKAHTRFAASSNQIPGATFSCVARPTANRRRAWPT